MEPVWSSKGCPKRETVGPKRKFADGHGTDGKLQPKKTVSYCLWTVPGPFLPGRVLEPKVWVYGCLVRITKNGSQTELDRNGSVAASAKGCRRVQRGSEDQLRYRQMLPAGGTRTEKRCEVSSDRVLAGIYCNNWAPRAQIQILSCPDLGSACVLAPQSLGHGI